MANSKTFSGDADQFILTRRQFLRTTALAISGATLAACAGALPTPTASTGTKVQLVYRDWRTEWFPPMAQQMLEEFHATHPNIRVYYNLDPENNEYDEKSVADLQSGTAPDVFQSCCSYFPIWAQKGYLLDLKKYVQADLDRATIEDWDSVQYKSFFTRDGRQYALPKYHGALALYYNKDLFDLARVDYPTDAWTHDDYLAAMKQIKAGKSNLGGSMIDIWLSVFKFTSTRGVEISSTPMIQPNRAWLIVPRSKRWNGFARACGTTR